MADWTWEKVQSIGQSSLGLVANISGETQALLLAALLLTRDRWRWNKNTGVTDAQWDEIQAWTGKASEELMTNALIGKIMITMGEVQPNELRCNGAIHNRVDYPELYASANNIYIVDADTFRVPRLIGRVPVDEAITFPLNSGGGAKEVTLSSGEMPRHRHGFSNYTYGVDIEGVGIPDPTGVGLPKIPGETTTFAGNSEAHENMPPYLSIVFVIIAR